MTDPTRRRSLRTALSLSAAALSQSHPALSLSRAVLGLSGAAIGLPGVATAASGGAPHLPRAAPPKAFTFTVIGDTPYSTLEERSLRDVLASQGSDIAFVLHVGDLKSGWERCSDELLRHRHALLAASARPLIFVPGDNEWVDCTRAPAGGFEPLDRLELLRRLFHGRDPAPSSGLDGFTRQVQAEPGMAFPEHTRWQHQGVGFLTFNVPGSHNARSADPRLTQANAARMAAVRRWLDEAPAWASAARLRALVIAAHANPNFERDKAGDSPAKGDDPDDAYAWWREGLRGVAARLPLPMLLLHGDTHTHRVDRPLRDRAGRPIGHVTRVECFGTPRATRWLTVSVPASDPASFSVAARELESAQRP